MKQREEQEQREASVIIACTLFQPQVLPPGARLTPGPTGAGRMQSSEWERGMSASVNAIHHRVPSSSEAPFKGLTRALQEGRVLTYQDQIRKVHQSFTLPTAPAKQVQRPQLPWKCLGGHIEMTRNKVISLPLSHWNFLSL